MKTIYLLPIGLIMTGLFACKKQSACKSGSDSKTTDIPPTCILNIINQLKQQPVRNPAASIYAYTYNGQQVYYITADCCDQYNLLYDANCNVICAPDGGLTGHGDGRCADFFNTRTGGTLVWQDPR